MHRGIITEIDLDAAAFNLKTIKNSVGNLPVFAVVKADAYGHGLRKVSKVLQDNGANALAVAFVSEAIELREDGITIPILVLFDRTEPEQYFTYNLIPVIHDIATAKLFSLEAYRRNKTIDLHIKLDTGMGRMGLVQVEEIMDIVQLQNIRIAGLLSHFSDADLADMQYMKLQMERFNSAVYELNKIGIKPLRHMANSAAMISFPDSHLDAVRPGLALYGCSPFSDNLRNTLPLKPLMSVKAKIASLKKLSKNHPVSYGRTFITTRETLTAVLAVGYADGYNRALSNNADVLINGKRAPVLGRVCMDLIVVDVTDINGVEERNHAVLLGRDGKEEITAWELALKASSIPYEIMTSFGRNASLRQFKGANVS